jgi:type VI secretion system secreted protein VgrG
MAGALVNNSVKVGGTVIRQFSSFTLTQGIFAHHQFRLVCPFEAIEGMQGELFAKSRDLMGEIITINLKDVDGYNIPLLFSGVVTQVESAKFSGYMGDVVITGFCPTILLDNGPHCNTWEKKALNNIASDVLGHFTEYIKNPVVNAAYGETFSYTVQYKETAWQFLSRLAATYGEWFFYNGQSLVFGQPKGKSASLVFGRDLSRFNIALELRPSNFQQLARDYVNDQLYDTTPNGIESKAGLNELGKYVYAKSKSIFSAQPKYWNNRFLTNKKQLEDNTNFRAAAQSSNMVKFYGSSSNQGVQLGNKISVKGQHINRASEEAYGEYVVIEVTHHLDGQGQYTNDFVAIPATIKVPPVTGYTEPPIESQSALVTDNHDPAGMGRVRVKFHWMKGSQKTPWIRVTSPHGGGGKGMFFIPELGEEVIVGFEGDSAVKPYVIGTVYHGKANSTFSNSGNDIKALQSRSGNKLVLDDAAKSVLLSDGAGNQTFHDGAGNIITSSTESITLTCGESTIVMKKDGTILINGKNISSIATENILSRGKNIGMAADEGLAGTARKTAFNGDDLLGLTSKDLKANGSECTTINGGKIDLGAAGDIAVIGALVKINS